MICPKLKSKSFVDGTVEKLDDTYISVFDGELDIISSLQCLQITLELTVVKEDLLHHISPFDESKGLLKNNTWFINLPVKMSLVEIIDVWNRKR